MIDWLGNPSVSLWAVLPFACWRHASYVMILYLAGLKALDPSLREAAAIDGASELKAFFTVVLPALKPINIVLVVITVIEALRAFDIVYIINRGRNGLELLSVLITDNIVGEASRIGYGSAIAVVLLDDLDRPDRDLRLEQLPGGGSMSTTTVGAGPVRRPNRQRVGLRRIALHAFLILTVLLWLSPILWAIFTAMRPYGDTSADGYVSWPKHFNFDNFTNAYTQSHMAHYFWNSMIVAIPSIFLILLFSSAVAFVVSRFSYWFTVPLLIFFMAANLLPQQVVLQPLYRIYLWLPLPYWLSDSGVFYDSYVGLIAINVAFQTGFCTFVLANYMKTIPKSLSEAARVDGAGVVRQYFQDHPAAQPAGARGAGDARVHLHLQRVPLGALILVSTGSKLPITAALNNLQGEFFTDNNLLAAGALMTALPTLLVFVVLQKYFVNGLTLGANKG